MNCVFHIKRKDTNVKQPTDVQPGKSAFGLLEACRSSMVSRGRIGSDFPYSPKMVSGIDKDLLVHT